MAFVHPEKQPSGLQQTGLWVALRQAELQVQVGSLKAQVQLCESLSFPDLVCSRPRRPRVQRSGGNQFTP